MVFLWIAMFSFSSCHLSFKAHFLVFFLSSMILSLTLISVSLGLVLGLVDFGTNPSSPCFLYAATQRSRLLLLCGHTLATSLSFSSLRTIGRTHLNLSSLIVVGIFIHIRQNIAIPEKPPYVCGHYPRPLTFYRFGCIIQPWHRKP